jgi:uncharacterized protein
MTRVVLDTNLLVSALLSPSGKPVQILKMAFGGSLDMVISPALLKEITLVLNYEKIRNLLAKHAVSDDEVGDVVRKILKTALVVPGKLNLDSLSRDPSDNIVLSCATEGNADFIVSGDRHLTELVSFEGIPVVSPDTFLKLVEKRE